MLLQDVVKYKPRSGKPFRVESINVALKIACFTELDTEYCCYDIGITLMGMEIAIHSGLMNNKKLEALGSSLKRMEEKNRKKNT